MKIHIRRAALQDYSVIVEFNAAMGKETEGIVLESRRLVRGVKEILRDSRKGFYVVAETNGRIVGQMMVTHEWSDWRSGYFWWIQSVYVLPSFRKKGIYRALHQHVVRQGKARKDICGVRLYVDKHNKRAQKVYRKLGMRRSNYDMFEEDFVLKRPA